MLNLNDIKNQIFIQQGLVYDEKDPLFSLLLANELVLGQALNSAQKYFNVQAEKIESFEQSRIALDQRLIQSQQTLAATIGEAEQLHIARLADAATAAKAEIDNQAQAHIERLSREACAIGDDEARHLREQSEKVRVATVSATLGEIQSGVAERLDLGLQGLEKANITFEKQGREFTAALNNITREADGAVKNYDESLRNSARNHRPVGLFGTVAISIGCGFAGVLMGVFVFSLGYLQLPERSLSETEKAQMTNGALLAKAWQKMSDQDKAQLQKMWN